MASDPYTVVLPTDQWVPLSVQQFFRATDGAVQPQRTQVRMKQDEHFLFVAFDCLDDPHWQHTTATGHNTDLWKQEVFELFIAEGSSTPTRYLEVEINPNDALFAGWVDNASGEGDANHLTMIPYEEAHILHRISTPTPDSWGGELRIPIRLICGREGAFRNMTFRFNLYRIVLLHPQSNPQWICAPHNASFQCWSPTLSGTTPRFHRPDSFGTLHFQ